MIGYILHDVQANGRAALTLEDSTPADPRLISTAPLGSLDPPNNISGERCTLM